MRVTYAHAGRLRVFKWTWYRGQLKGLYLDSSEEKREEQKHPLPLCWLWRIFWEGANLIFFAWSNLVEEGGLQPWKRIKEWDRRRLLPNSRERLSVEIYVRLSCLWDRNHPIGFIFFLYYVPKENLLGYSRKKLCPLVFMLSRFRRTFFVLIFAAAKLSQESIHDLTYD